MFRPILLLTSLIVVSTYADEYNGHHLGINTGFSTTKNFLGVFYSWDRNQINTGTNLTLFTFEEGVFFAQPSISYNRYLSNTGLYASVGLMATYRPESHESYSEPIPPDSTGHWIQYHDPSWKTSYLTFGIGKTFQYQKWGFNLDANLTTPIKRTFAQSYGLWLGAGLSYRFNLD